MKSTGRELTPQLQLQTLFVLEGARIVSTRDAIPRRGPAFFLVRSSTACTWGIDEHLPAQLAEEIEGLARQEPPINEMHQSPVHAARYQDLLGGRVEAGPAFGFPGQLVAPADVMAVDDESLLERHFIGWTAGEFELGAEPVIAVVADGHPVSVCFCARRSPSAAEAGLETAPAYRGRGYAARATTGWALAVRATGRVLIYSTSWTNAASLAVARKLELKAFAVDWSIER